MVGKKSNKYNLLIVLVAVVLMVLNRVMASSIMPEYGSNELRYLAYQLLVALSILGFNLIPLYLGYYESSFRKGRFTSGIGKYLLYYVIAILIFNALLVTRSVDLIWRNFWGILFPISSNIFAYGASVVLIMLIAPYMFEYLNKQKNFIVRRISIISTILLVVMPTIFSKDLWFFNSGNNPIWLLYLMLLGYVIKRFDWVSKTYFKFIHLIISAVIYFGLTWLMEQISYMIRANVDTMSRFNVPNSIFAMYLTLSIFIFSLAISKKIKVSSNIIAALLISTQVAINWEPNVTLIEKYLTGFTIDSTKQWLMELTKGGVIILVASVVIALLLVLLSIVPWFKKFANYLSFSSFDEFMTKLRGIGKWIISRKKIFYSALFFYLVTIVQMFSVSPAKIKVGVSTWQPAILFIPFNRQAAIVLNTVIVMAFLLFLYVITKRFWYSFAITLIIELALGIANYLKMPLRNEPVLPSDLQMLGGIKDILGMVDPVILIIGFALIFALIVLAIFLQHRFKQQSTLRMNWKGRVVSTVLLGIFLSGAFFVNHDGSIPFTIFNMSNINRYFYNQELGAQINGPIVQFINNVDTKVMNEPEGYSKSEVERVMKKYDTEANNINRNRKSWAKDQTFIFNLSESFSDPARVPNQTISSDPMPNIRKIKNNTTSGLMMSTGYGGGTDNIEWESLTGLDLSSLSPTLPTPYTQLVDNQNIAPNITNLFDEKIAVHPYVASLYNRKNVFKKFGFQKFYYVGSKDKLKYTDKIDDNPYINDESAYKDTLDTIDRSTNKTQFIQLSTMQNHMPFNNYYKKHDYTVGGTAAPDVYKERVEYYSQGLNYTDKATKDFLAKLDKINKPITLVWYGDHLASLFDNDSMDEYGIQLHQTDYFIYNNKYIRDRTKQSKVEVVSPYEFSALAMKQAGIKVSPYYAMMTKVTENLPAATTNTSDNGSNAFNGSQVFITDDSKKIKEDSLTAEQKEILHDYKIIQYDITAGKQYSAKWATQKVK
ncbi:LTA synthase family protein [Companilactobacillus insicii]|uniref:LTA synthase family protein n=1 Tax=Companilactobacillus insicii TaxID=1732567 RepID=UPI000F7B88E4|nr:alkaline phosphatase family protein [Companilactobacillus insicii]